jgi:hypothetical protein
MSRRSPRNEEARYRGQPRAGRGLGHTHAADATGWRKARRLSATACTAGDDDHMKSQCTSKLCCGEVAFTQVPPHSRRRASLASHPISGCQSSYRSMPYGREACAVGGLSSGLRRRVVGLQRYAAGLIVGHSNTEAGRQATWWTRKWHAADSTRGARVLCAGCVPTRKEYGNLARTQSICEVTQVTAGQHRGEQEPTRPMSRRVTLDQESPGSSPGGAIGRCSGSDRFIWARRQTLRVLPSSPAG